MSGIPLQIAEVTGRYERMLRRYTYGNDNSCPAGSMGHNAHTVIGIIDSEAERSVAHGDLWPHDDDRWPKACEKCDYKFTDEDQWQLNDNRICRLPDGTEFTFWGSFGRCAPAGAMLRADWYDEYSDQPGESWLIALPDGGEWITTQRASGGGYWEVTGTPPQITATPSIWHNAPHGWHGWVRDGFLVTA